MASWIKLKSFYAVISLYVLHILNSTKERHIYEALIMGSCPWVKKKRKEKENEIFHRKRNGDKKKEPQCDNRIVSETW